jgi:hypothetical protein
MKNVEKKVDLNSVVANDTTKNTCCPINHNSHDTIHDKPEMKVLVVDDAMRIDRRMIPDVPLLMKPKAKPVYCKGDHVAPLRVNR